MRTLQPRHRLHDDAWINWSFNDFGWMPDNRTLWLPVGRERLLAPVHAGTATASRTQLTAGHVGSLAAAARRATARRFYFLCNRAAARRLRSLRGRRRRRRGARADRAGRRRGLRAVAGRLAAAGAAFRQLPAAATGGGRCRRRRPARADRHPHRRVQGDALDPAEVSCRCRRKHGAGTIWGKYYAPGNADAGQASTRS